MQHAISHELFVFESCYRQNFFTKLLKHVSSCYWFSYVLTTYTTLLSIIYNLTPQYYCENVVFLILIALLFQKESCYKHNFFTTFSQHCLYVKFLLIFIWIHHSHNFIVYHLPRFHHLNKLFDTRVFCMTCHVYHQF